MTHRKQLTVFVIMLVVYAFCAFATYAFFYDVLAASMGAPQVDMGVSPAVLGLANAGIVLVVYGLLGLLGYWLARKLGLPGIYSPDGNMRRWVIIPLVLGLILGVFLTVADVLFAPINGFGRFVHPPFPISILASISAGIGEELMFRGFVFGLWALILNWVLRRFNGRRTALWIANGIAALAFAAGHLPSLMVLTETTSMAAIPPVLMFEGFLLNSLIGLVCGERYMKDGLVAAAGVHFWTDMVWHVLWGLV